ncbi:5356_t:CDS:1, partial [Ambispora gerdemannii]
MSKAAETDSVDINNKPQDNNKRIDIDYNNLPEEKSHWEKYQLYYLVFGSFFVTA